MSRVPFIRSFGYALSGVAEAFRIGRNFKVQAAFAAAAVTLCAAFTAFGAMCAVPGVALGPAEWAAVLACIALVLGGECFNTALEAVVDLASPERHDLARRAKDCAAGAVLVASAASLAVGLVLFLPRIGYVAAALFPNSL